jgi:F-type H+-transporting ATPase subunit delta
MQENLTVARPYAQAAYEHASAEGTLPAWTDGLALLAALVADPDMRRIIADPRIGRGRLQELLLSLGAGRFGGTLANFVKVLCAANRLAVAGEIAQLFEQRRAEAENVANVEIVTAFPLDATVEERITAAIHARLGKAVKARQRVDRGLIGGAIVRVGDTVYDLSLRGRLTQLANQFNWK